MINNQRIKLEREMWKWTALVKLLAVLISI